MLMLTLRNADAVCARLLRLLEVERDGARERDPRLQAACHGVRARRRRNHRLGKDLHELIVAGLQRRAAGHHQLPAWHPRLLGAHAALRRARRDLGQLPGDGHDCGVGVGPGQHCCVWRGSEAGHRLRAVVWGVCYALLDAGACLGRALPRDHQPEWRRCLGLLYAGCCRGLDRRLIHDCDWLHHARMCPCKDVGGLRGLWCRPIAAGR